MTGRHMPEPCIRNRWGLAKLLAGVILIAGLAYVLGSGVTPPGMLGDVIRHNREFQIDATPLFYSEVENMQELERGVAEMVEAARVTRVSGPLQD